MPEFTLTGEQIPAGKAVVAWYEASRALADALEDVELPLEALGPLADSARHLGTSLTFQFLLAGGELPDEDDDDDEGEAR